MTKHAFWGRLVVIGLALAGLTSCGGSAQGEPTVDINGTAVPARMKIATANVGGSYYPMGNAIAEVIGRNLNGVLATAETSSGSQHNIRMLDTSQVHFGMSNAAITYPALQGIEGFEKPFAVKAVISLHSSINLFVALKNSGIKTIADLKGKRVSMGPAGGGWDYYTRPILAAHGVAFEDIRPVYEAQSNAIEMLTDGTVDAVIVGGSVPHATIMAATATHELEFVQFDEAALDKVTETYPFIKKYPIPAGTYSGLTSDFWAVDSGTAQLLVRADADPDFVYLITKTIYENRDAIAQMHRPGAEITAERAAMDIGIPYHEGSLRYFNEIGIWNPVTETSGN